MSLINDALKRAKQAQQQPAAAPPAAPIQFRPVEPEAPPPRGPAVALPVTLAGAALLILLCAWIFVRRGAEPKLVAAKPRASGSESAARAAQSESEKAAPEPAAPEQVAVVGTQPTPKPSAIPTAPQSDSGSHAASPGAVASVPAATDVIIPQPEPLKFRLEAIIFNPKRPSAMIGGRTVFIGDRVSDYRVVSITQTTATLIGAGRTNILTLSD